MRITAHKTKLVATSDELSNMVASEAFLQQMDSTSPHITSVIVNTGNSYRQSQKPCQQAVGRHYGNLLELRKE